MRKKINRYISIWKKQGYKKDIPDECPSVLMHLNIAPSYKAICLAILRNDHNLTSLGFSSKKSEWYSILKQIELSEREPEKITKKEKQCFLFT